MALRFLLLQGLLCSMTLAAYRHSYQDPQPETIFISKSQLYGNVMHKLSERRVGNTGEWNQITSDNKQNSEFSYFTAYSRSFPEKDVGEWLDSKWIGGFTKKMRVCQMRQNSNQGDSMWQNDNQDDSMYLLTSLTCSELAPSNQIWEKFSFYVADEHRSEHETRRIYYASCQDPRSRHVFVQLSRNGRVSCGRNSRINYGAFYAAIPGTACSSINPPEGTQVQYNYNSGKISAAQVSCQVGYQLRGNREITCNRDGHWSSSTPYCSAIECGNPPINEPLKLDSEGPFHYNDWVGFTCPSGYQVDPPGASAHCNHAGRWNVPHATCKPVDCRYPGHPDHGETLAQNGYELGAEITFKCERGFRLDGAGGAVCMNDGQWSNPVPDCIAIRCEALRPLQNGIHTGSPSRYIMGEATTFQCNSGYSLVGESILTCEYNERTRRGVWSSVPPVCREISCPPPVAPENGKIFGTDYSFDAQISFQCDIGFLPQQAVVATCLRNGRWDASPPSCHVMQCRDPGTPEHATRFGDSFGYGNTLVYQCDVGYIHHGSKSITCNENGKWTGNVPICEAIGCEALSATMYGSKEGDIFEYNSEVTFSCFPGYELWGSNKTMCLSSGKWSEDVPICTACKIGYYKEQPGTEACQQCPVRSYTASEASNSRLQCICEPNTFGAPGESCQAVSCTMPSAPEHGSIIECATEKDDTCLFACDAGYILQGTRSRICTEAGWSGYPPVCVACPADTYKEEEGSLSCRPCPHNSNIPEGILGTSADVCKCKPGFIKNAQGDCEDVNECLSDNGGCEDVCENTPGSYVCKCSTGGYSVAEDGHSCTMTQTCSKLTDKVSNGYMLCDYTESTNGWFCRIKCDAGHFFVSGTNDYVTCGAETNFQWSHKIMNKTAGIPACTREFYLDVQLPVSSVYDSPVPCEDIDFDPNMVFEKMRVQEFIGTLHQCVDEGTGKQFCEVKNLSLHCEDRPDGQGALLTVNFEVLLQNKHVGPVNVSCDTKCKQQGLREMLGNAWNLTKEMKQAILSKPVGINVGSDIQRVEPKTFSHDRPKLLCDKPGRVFTRNRLCVPCDKGYHLPNRDLVFCLPCPIGYYQNQQSQTMCIKCLPTTSTLTEGSSHPAMCNVIVTEIGINTTRTDNNALTEEEEAEAEDIVRRVFL